LAAKESVGFTVFARREIKITIFILFHYANIQRLIQSNQVFGDFWHLACSKPVK
jgi:hypothetical protein